MRIRKMTVKRLSIVFLYAILLSSAGVAAFPANLGAQIPNFRNAISFSISPYNPRPNGLVTVKINSYSVNPDFAKNIRWFVNGNLLDEGAGKKEESFRLGKLGEKSVVRVEIVERNGFTVSAEKTIAPAEVDLMWEAVSSYVPPGYKGKALPASDNRIRLLAMPYVMDENGGMMDKNDMFFVWRKNDKIMHDKSGIGKDKIEIEGPRIFGSSPIEIEIKDTNGKTIAGGGITISAVQPEIVFYENSPLGGVLFNRALPKNFSLAGDEITVVSYPYFFSSEEKDGADLSYSWSIAGKKKGGAEESKSSITLRKVGEGRGNANVFLSIQNINNILESARNGFNIEYGKKKSFFSF